MPRSLALAFTLLAAPALAAEDGFLVAPGDARAAPVFRDAAAMAEAARLAPRPDPERLRPLLACVVETGTAARGDADMRNRRRRADTVEHWEVEVTAGPGQGCRGVVPPAGFGRAPGQTAAERLRPTAQPQEIGTLVPADGRTDITLWASRNAREAGVPLARQGVALANLRPWIACVADGGARVAILDDGAITRDVVVLDGPRRGCIGNIERGQFRRAPDQSVEGRLADPNGREVAVWRSAEARAEGLRLVQAGTHRTEPARVEALIACWAPSGAIVRSGPRDAVAAEVEVQDGPRRGCRGVVAANAFRATLP